MKQTTLTILSGLAIFMLAACSAEIKGGSEVTPPVEDKFSHKIQGPDLRGTWASACVLDKVENLYLRKTIAFSGNQVLRTANLHIDRDCTILSKKKEAIGIYRWVKVTTYGGYQLEYKFDLGGGVTTSPKEELLVEGKNLYLSDFHNEFGTISREVPLVRLNQ